MGELVHVRAAWGCLIYIMNTPTDDMNNIIMTGLKFYSVQAIYVTAVNVLKTREKNSYDNI